MRPSPCWKNSRQSIKFSTNSKIRKRWSVWSGMR